METERKVYCGNVDGEGTWCAFPRYPSLATAICNLDCGPIAEDHPCHVPDARLAALAKQDGELVELLKRVLNHMEFWPDAERRLDADIRAALRKRGVKVG